VFVRFGKEEKSAVARQPSTKVDEAAICAFAAEGFPWR